MLKHFIVYLGICNSSQDPPHSNNNPDAVDVNRTKNETAEVDIEKSQGSPSEKVWLELTDEADKTGLWKQLQVAREDLHQAVTLFVPVHSTGPQHWTLLQLDRPATSQEEEQCSQMT